MENPTAATSQINQSAQNIQQTLNSVGINSSILGQNQKWFYLGRKKEGKLHQNFFRIYLSILNDKVFYFLNDFYRERWHKNII